MGLLVASANGVAPDNAEFTFNHPDLYDKVGPFWASVQAWTHTADVSAGGFNCELEYDDPVGKTRIIGMAAFSLGDPEGINQSPVMPLERLSDVSNFKFRTVLTGSAGSALVSYRLVITQADICSIQALELVP